VWRWLVHGKCRLRVRRGQDASLESFATPAWSWCPDWRREVDTEAMKAAMEAKGRTIAVIGTPVDKVYLQRTGGCKKSSRGTPC